MSYSIPNASMLVYYHTVETLHVHVVVKRSLPQVSHSQPLGSPRTLWNFFYTQAYIW